MNSRAERETERRVFEGGEAVVGDEDGLHFFEVGVPVEGGVAAEEEVGYYAYGPDVAGGGVSVSLSIIAVGEGMWGEKERVFVHWFSVPRFLEDFGCHVPWCTACCSQDVKRFFVHYPRKAKIRYEEICVVFWCSEEEIFGFEISVDNAVVVQIGHC